MKILRIDIHNIASIEDASIDFATGPLADEKLFLICGETGSGKTTILNSICLALYNSTPALLTYGNNDKDANGVTTRNSSQMLRRGAKDGYVNLDFEGNDGIAYRAVWSARKIKTRDKSLKIDVKTRIERLSDGAKTETPVAELTGLTFKQFTQTTILAQGQFTKFLLADEAEKAEILEKLTGTEVYAAIGRRIYDTMRQKEDALKSLNDRIAGAKLLGDDEKKALADELPALRGAIIKCTRDLNAIDAKLKWLADAEAIAARLSENAAMRDAAEAALRGEEHLRKAESVRIWEATARVRVLIGEMDKAETDLRYARSARPRLREKFAAILGAIDRLIEEKRELQGSVEALTRKLEKIEPQAEMLAQAPRIEVLAKSVVSERSEAAKCCERAQALGREIATARVRLEAARVKVKKAVEKHESSAIEAKKRESEAGEFDLKSITEAAERLRDQAVALKVAYTAIEKYHGCKSQREQADSAVREAAAETDALKAEIRCQDEAIPPLESACREKQSILSGMMEIKDHIQSLRLRFADSHECPLCGSKGVDLATDALLEGKVGEAQAEADAAKEAFDKASASLAKGKASLSALEKDLRRKCSQANAALTAEANARAEAEKAASAVGVDCDDEGYAAVIESRMVKVEQGRAAQSEMLKNALAAQTAWEEARKAMEKDRECVEAATKDADAIDKSVSALAMKIESEETLRVKAIAASDEALCRIKEMLCEGYAATPDNILTISEEISAKAKGYETDRQNRTAGIDKLSAMEARISEAVSAISPLCEAFPGTEGSGTASMPDISREISGLIAETSAVDGRIESLSALVAEKREQIDAYLSEPGNCSREQIEEAAKYTPEQISEYKEEIKVDADRLVAARAAYGEIERRKAEHQQAKPDLADDDTPESLAARREDAEAVRDSASKRQAAVEALLKDDADRADALAETKRDRDALKEECANWAVLEDLYGGAKGQKFRLMAQSYVLRTLLYKANHYLAMLSQRYELCCSDNSLVINVIDHDQSNIVRAVTLLSGGESFIVSLSLALGLSAISKERLDVDTLFIDEGFGTLDNSMLETVIATLDRLHRIGGRRVGIISHVTSLAERIPTQIRMRRTGPGTSAIDVVVN